MWNRGQSLQFFYRDMGEMQMNKINFLTNLTILLVEDDASALRQMEIMLRKNAVKFIQRIMVW